MMELPLFVEEISQNSRGLTGVEESSSDSEGYSGIFSTARNAQPELGTLGLLQTPSGIAFQCARDMEPRLRVIPCDTRDDIGAVGRDVMDELLPSRRARRVNAEQLKDPAPRFGVPYRGIAAQAFE
jgi:hypothetical protein